MLGVVLGVEAAEGTHRVLHETGQRVEVEEVRFHHRGGGGARAIEIGCQPVGFPLSTDMSITLSDIAATDNGFNARAFIRRPGCAYSGRFGGVRLTPQ